MHFTFHCNEVEDSNLQYTDAYSISPQREWNYTFKLAEFWRQTPSLIRLKRLKFETAPFTSKSSESTHNLKYGWRTNSIVQYAVFTASSVIMGPFT